MRVLIDKELRELVPMAVFLLAIAAAIGSLDLLYNWRVDHCLGISLSLCYVLAYGIALLGGANAVGRESRDNLAFLASWPVRRGTIWLVKFALNLGIAALTAALCFAICLDLVRIAGYSNAQLAQLVGDLGPFLLIALWFFAFALTFFWSTMVRIPIAAVGLAFPTAVVLTVGLSYILESYLPDFWGPWLGLNPSRLEGAQWNLLAGYIVAGVGLVAFAASAVAFLRTPMLESKRRVFLGLAWLLGMTLAFVVLGAATYAVATRPSLADVAEVAMDRAGQHLVLRSLGRGSGVWAADLAGGGEPRLLARGDTQLSVGWAGGPLLPVYTSGGDAGLWLVDLRTREMRHVGRYVSATSPSGRLLCVATSDGLAVQDVDGRAVLNLRVNALQVAFSLDDRHVYAWRPSNGRLPPGEERSKLLTRIDLTTGQSATVADVPGSAGLINFSPSGRLACTIVTRGAGRAAVQYLVVIDLQTGKQSPFPDLYPTGMGWSGDDRYVWAEIHGSPRNPNREFRIIDTRTMTVVRSLGPTEMLAAAGPPMTAAGAAQQSTLAPQQLRNGLIYFASGPPFSADPQKILWVARPDGTGLRLVCRDHRRWLGVDAAGDLVFWDHHSPTRIKITLLDPSTGHERPLFSAP
jgi:ABC-type transport system involved in multi-copper enzyme maturation permease subunit